MIKDPVFLDKFEKDQIRRKKPNYMKSLHIFEALWNEALNIGILPLKDPLAEIDSDIRIAKFLNSRHV